MTTNKRPPIAITGSSLPKDEFAFREVDAQIDPQHLRALLDGQRGPLIVRNFISQEACRTITANFAAALDANQRSDGVQGVEVGTGHFGKTLDEYFDRVDATRDAVANLWHKAVDVPARVARSLEEAVGPGMVVRPARHDWRSAASMRATVWQLPGPFSLAHHEDLSQLSQTAQRGAEFQEITVPVSCVVYAAMPARGGEFRLHNMAPDVATRQRLGVSETGHPYPLDALDGIDFIETRTEAGSAIFFDGRYLHAVRECFGAQRLSLTSFFGLNRDRSAVLIYT